MLHVQRVLSIEAQTMPIELEELPSKQALHEDAMHLPMAASSVVLLVASAEQALGAAVLAHESRIPSCD